MGVHPDFHVTRVLHHWRSRAKAAEALLRRVSESCDDRWCKETMKDIRDHLERNP